MHVYTSHMMYINGICKVILCIYMYIRWTWVLCVICIYHFGIWQTICCIICHTVYCLYSPCNIYVLCYHTGNLPLCIDRIQIGIYIPRIIWAGGKLSCGIFTFSCIDIDIHSILMTNTDIHVYPGFWRNDLKGGWLLLNWHRLECLAWPTSYRR